MHRVLRPPVRKARRLLTLLVLVALVLFGTVASAAAGPAGSNVAWRNEGLDSARGWTTGEIGGYGEGDLVPFRFTVTNPSNTKSAFVGGFSVQLTAENHGVAVFDSTTDWSGPIVPDTKDGLFDDMLRTTFPAGLTLAPGESATFSFKGRLAVSTATKPAAGMLNGNGVAGFSEIAADGVGAFGKRVPVKVNARSGLLGTPAIDLVASSDAPTSGVPAGTEVTFTYRVTNVGDVPLFDATVRDSQLGTIGAVPGPLAAGESAILSATRVVSETVVDSATVTASDEIGREATDTEEFSVSVLSSARVFGSVYEDRDLNGAWDAGEAGLAGWVVRLLDGQGDVVATALTDSLGAYSFDGLTPNSTYVVSAVEPVSWLETAPIGGTFTVVPTPGQDAGPYDFGEAYYQVVE